MSESQTKERVGENVFDVKKWSASVLRTPREAEQKIAELLLEGRVIRNIVSVGNNYSWCDSNNSYATSLVPVGGFECGVEIDQPMMIEFEDGDVLAILYCDGGTLRMELNALPLDIRSGINPVNFHANRLFSDVIGKQIRSVKVISTMDFQDYSGAYGAVPPEEPPYICRIDIVYRGSEEMSHTLSFLGWDDYGFVFNVDETGHIMQLPGEKIRWVTEGFS